MNPFLEQVAAHAAVSPERTAIVTAAESGSVSAMTYGELMAWAHRFARLLAHTTRPDSILPIYANRTGQCVAAMLGAMAAGRGFSVLNTRLRQAQVQGAVAATRAEVAIIDPPGFTRLRQALTSDQTLRSVRWLVIDEEGAMPAQQQIQSKLVEGGLHIASVESELADLPEPRIEEGAHGIGCCLFTSGSTGSPKGVLVSSEDLSRRAEAEAAWFDLRPEDILLGVLPFSFDVGLNQLMSSLTAGCTLVLLGSWLPVDIVKAIEAHSVTGLSAVPAIWSDFLRLQQDASTSNASLGTLRYVTVSGGDLARSQLDRLEEALPDVLIFKTYGQTEAFRATSLHGTEFRRRPTSVGRPFSDVRVYVVGPDGTPCPTGDRGEVVHTGLGTMVGYLDGQDPTGKLRPNPFRGPADSAPQAIFTGDQGYLDEDGYLYLCGRADSMAKIQGNRVYPAEVAAALLALAGVYEAEVVAIAGEDGQQQLCAFAVGESDDAWAAGLRMQLARTLPAYMVPERVVATEAIPRTANNKPDRVALVQEATRLCRSDSEM